MRQHQLEIPSKYEHTLCRLFAEACVGSNQDEYARRDQQDQQKITEDISRGKLAEIMIYRFVFAHQRQGKPHPVDFFIYDKGSKSFDADIQTADYDIHVKSCMGDSQFPNSWVFQPNDSLITIPKPNDMLALVVMSANPYCYYVLATEVSYEDPIKANLNKKVIYEEGL